MKEALNRLEPLRHVRAGPLDVGYFEAGPFDGEVTLLLHGFPYDIHSYVDVIHRAWLDLAGCVQKLRRMRHQQGVRRAARATSRARTPRLSPSFLAHSGDVLDRAVRWRASRGALPD